ncbi:MAG: BtpA/SgcQ family protein [Bacilli bacterium]|nr:BtpA/SgcQ family protein [Bacilli bacterium]MDD4406659.1 BtpA/SgcQ family protein [Bacilli bacterium]
MNKFLDLFEKEKPIIGMLHLGKRNLYKDALDLTKYELNTYLENGIDGVIVEDYFGDYNDVERTLEYLYVLRNDVIYGVNYLRNYKIAFELAQLYKAKFIQIDSVAGHLLSSQDEKYAQELNELRNITNIPVIGGVRFKYQPYLSERSLKEDLELGMQRCDGIVVTGDATGLETPLKKAAEFKHIIKDFPLIIGAGLTPDNCIPSLTVGDAAIVGSYVKHNHKDSGIVSAKHVKKLVYKVKTIRK